jgi:serine/threonine-protein kinase
MAEVQLALQRGPAGFEKLVVVKLVHDSLATQKAFVDMLLDEARVAALVKHPNVVDIYDLGQADGRYFIAMEYLEGEPMLGVLRAGREGKRLDPLSTGRLIADTAEGLDAAHELRSMSGERLELVHHDISLGNIVVLYNGQVKLVDFGVAKATQSANKDSKVQGKFSYMAPEKLRGSPGDRRSDLFSLGCVMWEALTLKRLFRGGNDGETMKQVLEMAIQPPSKVNSDVPPEYDAIVMRSRRARSSCRRSWPRAARAPRCSTLRSAIR